jgi:hypothetical protein
VRRRQQQSRERQIILKRVVVFTRSTKTATSSATHKKHTERFAEIVCITSYSNNEK